MNEEERARHQATRQRDHEISNDQMLVYFWEEKHDLERWVGWDDPHDRADVERRRPEVIKAWNDYVVARKTLDAVIAQLRDSLPVDW